VVGHSKGEMDGRYIGTIPLEEIYPAIRACGWPDLQLPDTPPLGTSVLGTNARATLIKPGS
jgi:hypothetical protein